MIVPSKINNLKDLKRFTKMISSINGDLTDKELNSVIYTSHVENLTGKENLNNFIKNVQKFLKRLKISKITFFRDENSNWLKYLSFDNEAEELNFAYKYLNDLINAKSFKGVFIMETSDLSEFLPHIISFTQFQGGLPNIYFASDDSNLLFHICKYCNLHIYFYENKVTKPNYFKSISPTEEFFPGLQDKRKLLL